MGVFVLLERDRKELMGVAILMVLLYHMCCWLDYHTLLLGFSFGYSGVDIFFLLSGYGLCYSYQQNSVLRFYYKRIKRIFPLFIVYCFFCVLIDTLIGGGKIDNSFILNVITQTLACSSTLTYYNIIEGYSNWYVSTIVLFYILFPLLFVTLRKYPITFFLTASLFICVEVFGGWFGYDISISRIPVFMMGIIIYHVKNDKKSLIYLLLITLLLWNLSICYHLSHFLQTAFFTPLLIVFAGQLKESGLTFSLGMRPFLQYLGSFSYELFLSNHFTKLTIENLDCVINYSIFSNILIYFICTVVYGYVFIQFSTIVNQKRLS